MKRQKCLQEHNAAVLITIESHSIKTEEVLRERNASNSTMKYALLSEGGNESAGIHEDSGNSSESDNSINLWILDIKKSRKDTETLMQRLELKFIVGFLVMIVNPTMISDMINSFCVALHCKSMPVMEGFKQGHFQQDAGVWPTEPHTTHEVFRNQTVQVARQIWQTLQMVNTGADPQLVWWHLKEIKKMLPQEENILEAMELLMESVYNPTHTCCVIHLVIILPQSQFRNQKGMGIATTVLGIQDIIVQDTYLLQQAYQEFAITMC
ncbi:hypothetical protein L210DRAFT_3507780 [Boletus edulis BED1]|uniref:Uncharacterized protein n=1 Tax=Boletus edulis BED1 TaxID=1328754 RepID=A0AAD4BI70_BOLED|nr:hypothetical protein L210DRAFT_3507780 [Boletus edulis BED1]